MKIETVQRKVSIKCFYFVLYVLVPVFGHVDVKALRETPVKTVHFFKGWLP